MKNKQIYFILLQLWLIADVFTDSWLATFNAGMMLVLYVLSIFLSKE